MICYSGGDKYIGEAKGENFTPYIPQSISRIKGEPYPMLFFEILPLDDYLHPDTQEDIGKKRKQEFEEKNSKKKSDSLLDVDVCEV
jgi:hypothetical protein